jgi:hypothetical protein
MGHAVGLVRNGIIAEERVVHTHDSTPYLRRHAHDSEKRLMLHLPLVRRQPPIRGSPTVSPSALKQGYTPRRRVTQP